MKLNGCGMEAALLQVGRLVLTQVFFQGVFLVLKGMFEKPERASSN